MKILHEGTANKRDKMTCTCDFCESELRIWHGDPMSHREWDGHNEVHYVLNFICPVCGSHNVARTYHDTNKDEFILEEKALMNREDKEEVKNFENFSTKDLSIDDMNFVHIRRYSQDDPRLKDEENAW